MDEIRAWNRDTERFPGRRFDTVDRGPWIGGLITGQLRRISPFRSVPETLFTVCELTGLIMHLIQSLQFPVRTLFSPGLVRWQRVRASHIDDMRVQSN